MHQQSFEITEKVWLYPGEAAWHFVTLPVDIADEINFHFGHLKRGWGSLPVLVEINNASWKTSIFTDKKSASYLLPVKADIRKKLKIKAGDTVVLSLTVQA
jgi:hypothetical protein